MLGLIWSLKDHFREQPDVYVSGNLLTFYEPGNPRKHIAPDVMVVMGVPSHQRKNYKIWEEGKAPDMVIEVTSESTWKNDLGHKMELYAQHGVQEYVLFDPLKECLEPQLQGFRLVDGSYMPMGQQVVSDILGLHFQVISDVLRLHNPQAGALLPLYEESMQHMRHLISQLGVQPLNTESERQRADSERLRADAEKQRTDDASETARRLAARLRALGETVD